MPSGIPPLAGHCEAMLRLSAIQWRRCLRNLARASRAILAVMVKDMAMRGNVSKKTRGLNTTRTDRLQPVNDHAAGVP